MRKNSENHDLITDPGSYFSEAVEEAVQSRGLTTKPASQKYLVDLLQFYLHTENLFQRQDGVSKTSTLAEMFLLAHQSEPAVRFELLKKLGDSSLYISGFFG